MRKLTKEEFVNRAIKVHGNKYDYSKVVYINSYTKVIIICPIHGEFEQTPYGHMKSTGCLECGRKKANNSHRMNQEDYIKKVNIVHNNKFDYSKLVYVDMHKKIIIICPDHGEFKQKAQNHLIGHGCPKEKMDKIKNKLRKNLDEAYNKMIEVHSTTYEYVDFKEDYKKYTSKIRIICKKHGEFKQGYNKHVIGHGCRKCNMSKGEREVSLWLNKNNIQYETQKRFPDCKNKRSLPFDFYIPDYNMCIEYDGQQHFKPNRLWLDKTISEEKANINFERTQLHDKIKNKYCKDKGIILVRIRYNEKLIKKLEKTFNEKS